MVGRVRVRGQGPVRRGQTTTTFKKGGRVKKQLGGAMPGVGAAGAARPLAAGVQRPLAAGSAGVQRPLGRGYKTGGRVKKASGGSLALRLLKKDLVDSRKKLNVHQDPSSGLSASLRNLHDNRSKKKTIRSPHTAAPKKRTLKDMYHKKTKDFSELMKKAPKGVRRKK